MRCLNLIGHFCVIKRNFISLFLDKILKKQTSFGAFYIKLCNKYKQSSIAVDFIVFKKGQ